MPLPAFIHWNIDPEIFRIGPVAPRWYGSFFALGFLVAYFIGIRIWRRERRNENELSTLFVYIFLGTIIGARLGHCLFYDPGYYLRHPLEILKIWEGGLASHGGALGVAIALALYTRKMRQDFLWLADRACAVIPFVAGCIRMGNFFNSEIIGKPSTLPWAIVFEKVDTIPRHPAQLYEALAYFLMFIPLITTWNRLGDKVPRGLLAGRMFVFLFGARFLIEFIKENQEPFESALPLNMGQLLSIPFIVVGIILWIRASRSSEKSAISH